MARFVPELNDIQEMLDKKGIGYACVRGGIKDRAEEIKRFQEDPDCRIFIGQIAAAGLGITHMFQALKDNWQPLCEHHHNVKTMTEDNNVEYRF